jgi:paraquat-inducible protein B
MAAARPAAVGGFVLGGLALAVAAVLLFGGSRLFTRTLEAVVFFRGSVAGLNVGSPVTFRGVRVGSVRDIRLRLDASDLTAQIPVYLELDPTAISIENGTLPYDGSGFKRLLAAGLRAQITAQSFVTGQLQVDLDLRPGVPELLVGTGAPGVPEIPAMPSTLQALRDKVEELPLQEIVETARQALNAIRQVSDQLASKMDPFADTLQKTMEAAHTALQTSSEAVSRLQADVSRTLGEVDKLTIEGRVQITERGTELGRLLAATNKTVEDTAALSRSLAQVAAPRSQIRGDLEAAVRDLAATASSLRNFSREVERNPSSILTGRAGR